MVSQKELAARIKDFFRFSPQEISGLIFAVIVTGFVFSFRDWGKETFDFSTGLSHLITVFIIAAITFSIRLASQKIYALREGYQAEFKVWWVGLIIMLLIAFLSFGWVPLVLIGGVAVSFMVKQRLGEFRYGFSLTDNAVIALWGILSNLILAILFAIGTFFRPESFFFNKALILNLMMAFTSLFPFPQLEGLNLFFGSRILYFISLGMVFLEAILLLTKTKIGLIICILIALIIVFLMALITSEK